MSTPVKLRLYCSICARNDFYMDRIRAVADGLGLDYTLEKITDDDVIDWMDLRLPRPGEGGRSPKFYLTNRHKPHKINVKLF